MGWLTVEDMNVDKVAVDEMNLDKMTACEMTVNEITVYGDDRRWDNCKLDKCEHVVNINKIIENDNIQNECSWGFYRKICHSDILK